MKKYVFTLYIAGQGNVNKTAIQNLTSLCKTYLKNSYNLTIIDIEEHPELAEKNKILAIPTLIKELPEPVQKYIGNLSDKNDLKIDLGLDNV